MVDICCPECGEDDRLAGERQGELIAITCHACGREWTRDPSPRCGACGGDELVAALKAIIEKSRGSQLSIVSTEVIHLCRLCDASLVKRYLDGRTPIMPDDLPTNRQDDG